MGMCLAYVAKVLIEQHILNHEHCRKRVLIMTPYYMTMTSYLMIGAPLTKNYSQSEKLEVYTALYITFMIIAPFIFLILFRYILIRRARNVEVVKLRRRIESRKDRRKAHLTSSSSVIDSNATLDTENADLNSATGTKETESYFKIDTHYC